MISAVSGNNDATIGSALIDELYGLDRDVEDESETTDHFLIRRAPKVGNFSFECADVSQWLSSWQTSKGDRNVKGIQELLDAR